MCAVLDHIQSEITKSYARTELANVHRLLDERDKHIDKCFTCANTYRPLYLQMWTGAVVTQEVKPLEQHRRITNV